MSTIRQREQHLQRSDTNVEVAQRQRHKEPEPTSGSTGLTTLAIAEIFMNAPHTNQIRGIRRLQVFQATLQEFGTGNCKVFEESQAGNGMVESPLDEIRIFICHGRPTEKSTLSAALSAECRGLEEYHPSIQGVKPARTIRSNLQDIKQTISEVVA